MRSSNRRAAAGPAGPPGGVGPLAPPAEAWEEEVTAALVAGWAEAERAAEAIPAWMEGDAATAANSLILKYLIDEAATNERTDDGGRE